MADRVQPGLIDKYYTIIITLGFFAGGIILLIVGYNTDPAHSTHPYPLISFLLEQAGALALFSGVYTFINDYFVRKNFEKEVRAAVDFVQLDQSIKDFGVVAVSPKFEWSETIESLNQSTSVTMLVLSSRGFFEGNYTKLLKRLQMDNFSLKIVLPNPNNQALISLLAQKMSSFKNNPQELAEKIVDVVNNYLKEKIYDELKAEQSSRFSVCFINKYPLYSAYLFDRRQFWYVPYHYRDDHQDLPVFIFESNFDQSEVYRDFDALLREAVKQDLSKPLTNPSFLAKS